MGKTWQYSALANDPSIHLGRQRIGRSVEVDENDVEPLLTCNSNKAESLTIDLFGVMCTSAADVRCRCQVAVEPIRPRVIRTCQPMRLETRSLDTFIITCCA